jgi:glycosyltransferase involved in cell wall biosynthesis
MLHDGETGVLVPPSDPLALAEALAGLVSDPERREALGRAAAADVNERFSTARMLDAIHALYDRLVS